MTNVQPDGAGEQAAPLECLTPPDQAAPWSPYLEGSYKGIAMAKPPLVMENTVWLPKSKSLEQQGALEPTQDTQKAEWMEAAGAQAVERGHKVHMYEVPDQEDDTSFMMNMKAKIIPTIEIAVTSPTVVEPSRVDTKAEKVPHEWLKPFGAEWTLHGIIQAKTESEAKAILKNWIHKARVEEVVDKMIEGMWKAE